MFYVPVILALFVWSWPRIWFRVVRQRVDVEVSLSTKYVEIGDELTVTVVVRNRSWLPCPQIMLALELPPGLSAEPSRRVSGVSHSTFLLMRQEVTFSVRCYGYQRGLQELRHREIILRMNEGFGLRELFVRREISGSVIVYPKRVTGARELQALRELNGDIERVRWLFPDEALLRGIRSYELGDPFKHIAWHATAKTGQWMTKQFSSSTDVSVGIILNAQFVDPHWLGTKVAVFDELCSYVVAFCEGLEQKRIPVFFASNAIHPGSTKEQWFGRVSYGATKNLVGAMLPYTNGDCLDVLSRTLHELPQDSPLVFFTGFLTGAQAATLSTAARVRPVYIVAPDHCELPKLPSVEMVIFQSRAEDTIETAAGEKIPSARAGLQPELESQGGNDAAVERGMALETTR